MEPIVFLQSEVTKVQDNFKEIISSLAKLEAIVATNSKEIEMLREFKHQYRDIEQNTVTLFENLKNRINLIEREHREDISEKIKKIQNRKNLIYLFLQSSIGSVLIFQVIKAIESWFH